MKPTDLSIHLTNFLTRYLAGQRNLSSNTIKAYRDVFILLLRFARDARGVAVERHEALRHGAAVRNRARRRAQIRVAQRRDRVPVCSDERIAERRASLLQLIAHQLAHEVGDLFVGDHALVRGQRLIQIAQHVARRLVTVRR